MRVSLIEAIGRNRELGKDNKLIWHIPADLKHFKEKTRGHVVIMGRKTFESIGKPLPERTNIVVTSDVTKNWKGVHIAESFDEALLMAQEMGEQEAFVIGGAKLYETAIQKADRLYITLIDAEAPADTFFPEFENDFHMVSEENHSDGKLQYAYTVWER